jgi:hypothetical protein
MEPSASLGPRAGAGYSGGEVVVAAPGALLFAPFALIAALLLQRRQGDPRKRSQLRTWAWISGGVLGLEVVWFLLQTPVT